MKRRAKDPEYKFHWLRTVLVLTIVLATAGTASAQIRNSKHDFSSSGNGGIWASQNINEICIFCHIPHHALSTQYVWNRTLTQQDYLLYTSSSMKATPSQPTNVSRRCLSCHDGSTAVDAFNSGRGGPPQMMALGDVYYPGSPWGAGGANIGGNYKGNLNVNNLSDDHPVSFIFDAALAAKHDGDLQDPGKLAYPLPLYNNRLECPTCHEVHNSNTADGGKFFLRVTLDTSSLCRNCHLK